MGRPQKLKKKKKGWRTAKTSDIHELYELSVQAPDAEVEIIDQVWEEQRGRRCVTLREDFCGTAQLAMEWVKYRDENKAWGVDLEPSVLDWARTKVGERLDDGAQSRIELIEGDVLDTSTPKVDLVLATNFSYYLFKKRAALLNYFKTARSHLVKDGIFMLDAYGGSEAFVEMDEERDLDGFTYVWDQAHYDPISGDTMCHIHFKFPDRSKIKKAFTYDWRLWTLPEIRELLEEAGFSKVLIYWEGTDEETEEGNGEWEVATVGEACQGWVAYIVALK